MLSLLLCAALLQEADTLKASVVSTHKDAPVLRPLEEVHLGGRKAAPVLLSDVLRRFTGVQIKDYGGAGGLKTVNVRSLGSEHVGVFLDGIQIDNAQNMQVDLGRYSTQGLEGVALWSGAKALRLQSAKEYAGGAAVHLLTAAPQSDSLLLRLRGGSFGTLNPSLQWDKRLRPRIAMRLGAEYLGSNGRYPYQYFDTTLVRENGDCRALRLEALLSGQTGRGEWRLRLHGYGSQRGFPGPVIRRAIGFPLSAERQEDRDFFAQGFWTQDWTGRYSTALRFKLSSSYTHYDTHPEKNPMAMPYNIFYRLRSAYVSLSQSLEVAEKWYLDLSADLDGCTLGSDVGQFVSPRRGSVFAALSARYQSDRFRAGAHLTWMGAADSFDKHQAGLWTREDASRSAWMPSAGISWNAATWLEIDAFAKRSYRLPTFNDLYYSLMGNASLRPESAFQTGFDFRAHNESDALGWEVRVSPYYNRVSDKIVAIPTTSQFRWTMLNIGLADIVGLDVKGAFSRSWGGWNAGVTLRYTFQRALDHSSPGSLTYGNQIPYIPLHSGTADASLGYRGWTLIWEWSFTSERWSRSANTDDYRIAPWTVSDLVLTKEFGGRLQLGVRVSNIFGRSYQLVQGYPMPGRSIMASISYSPF